jgi:hypothetical protein
MEEHGSIRIWPRLFCQSCGYSLLDLSMALLGSCFPTATKHGGLLLRRVLIVIFFSTQ